MLGILLQCIGGIVALILGLYWTRHKGRKRQMLGYMITPDTLHQLMQTDHKPIILDLRVPLDLLANSEMIPGSRRIAQSDIAESLNLLSDEQDCVLYCTCPGENSSEAVLADALSMGLVRVKVLAGGLEAWKERGYPVEPYNESFHLQTY